MKRYYIKGTDEELKVGDIVELTFVRVYKGGDEEEFFNLEKRVDEELLKQYLSEDFLEVYGSDDDPVEFVDENETIEALIEANEELEKRTENLEDEIKRLKKAVNLLIKCDKEGKFESNSVKK